MIVFDLKCKAGHVFEAWFADSKAFARQKSKKLISCPACGDTHVAKAPMAPRIASGKSRGANGEENEGAERRQVAMAASPEAKALLGKIRELKEHIEKNCEYVGGDFAEQARKIHYGETEQRNIYGETSDEQASALAEEGVEFQRIPWPRGDA